jgi:hypothetical protein
MPTIFQDGPYSFIFFSSDEGEPIHIHVKRDRDIAKFWLEPVTLANNHGFKGHELNRIQRLVAQYRDELIEAWNDYFDA